MNALNRPTLALLFLLACGSAWAQPGAQPAASAARADAQAPVPASTTTQADGVTTTITPADEAPGQRVQHIQVEDGGSRIDEVRTGGETKSITVQPKTGSGNMPAYDVRPPTHPGNMNRRPSAPGQAGERTWKVLEF